MTKINEIIKKYTNGIDEIIFINELKKKLLMKTKLNIKVGFDPTAPDIHLGHSILLNKTKQFQEKGNKIIIIIGDFTGMIGDPTGKKNTRIQLSKEIITKNSKTYKNQIFKILNKTFTKIKLNSTWLNKITAENFIKLASKQTIAKMLQREDFNKRYNKKQPIHIHEFLYPLIQAYDSNIVKAHVEIGGTDQKFNLLMGRHLQNIYKQKKQIIITTPIIEGINGKEKMSKSLNNYISINDSGENIFGKIISISDEKMFKYIELLTNIKKIKIKKIIYDTKKNKNPRDLKLNLSYKIIKIYDSKKEAHITKKFFVKKYIKKFTSNIEKKEIKLENHLSEIKIIHILKEIGFSKNILESIKQIQKNLIKINNKNISNIEEKINKNTKIIIELGKKKKEISII